MATQSITMPPMDEMFRLVGVCLQRFSMLEFGLAMIYASLMEPGDRQLSVLTLEGARHFETRLRIVRTVGKYKFGRNKRKLARFNNVMNRIGRKSKIRDKLAHWSVSYWPGASTVEQMRKMKPALAPGPSSALWGAVMWGDERPILEQDLKRYDKDCLKLIMDLVKYSNSIRPRKNRSKKPSKVVRSRVKKKKI